MKKVEEKMAIDETINNYNWNEPISKNPGLAYEALKACILDNFNPYTIYSPEMKILRHKTNGEPPRALISNETRQIGIGIPDCCDIWVDYEQTLTDLVNKWNKEQGMDDTSVDNSETSKSLNDTYQRISEVCDSIKELLLEKNRKYGNSALNPCRIFARSDRLEQIRVRIDDKLNRIKNEQSDEDEDVVKDLIGYLVLYQVAKMEE